ncbi:MAG: hypothetical protein IPH60_16875 [Flavobacteriales bacterium]|nr:hypothetical protein [Flavobacteriales bacterium]
MNDEPCGAVLLTVGSSCSLTASSNAAATLSSAAQDPGCGNLSGSSRDVWFRFVVPASGIVIIQSTAGTLTDGAMALYAGSSCSASGLQLLDCSDDEGPGYMPFLRYADLVPGDTYYLRYWGYGSGNGTFNLCVWSRPCPWAKHCVYMLELFDSGENGWGTSAVQVVVNGGTPVNHAVTGYYTVALIGLNTNDLFQTSYVNTGPNQNQNRYQIRQVPGGFGVLEPGAFTGQWHVLVRGGGLYSSASSKGGLPRCHPDLWLANLQRQSRWHRVRRGSALYHLRLSVHVGATRHVVQVHPFGQWYFGIDHFAHQFRR